VVNLKSAANLLSTEQAARLLVGNRSPVKVAAVSFGVCCASRILEKLRVLLDKLLPAWCLAAGLFWYGPDWHLLGGACVVSEAITARHSNRPRPSGTCFSAGKRIRYSQHNPLSKPALHRTHMRRIIQ
jgi:hypothetical protein